MENNGYLHVDGLERSSSYHNSVPAGSLMVTRDVGLQNPTHEIIEIDQSEYPGEKKRRSTILEADQGTHLSWHNVNYSVMIKMKGEKKKQKKFILQGMTGELLPGEMCCIMGTSGSGKTSMLNVLSGRHVTGDIEGKILCDKKKRNSKFRRLTAYVEQDDMMFGHLTVQETLMYTALLRLPGKMPRKHKNARVDEVVAMLGLKDCRNTRIGDSEKRGVSGGERKRTSIGVELIVNPEILFLDEPTSGLDSYTAYHIMETVRGLTESGRSVICSIHQPREKIFKLFDKILLLSQGQTCFYGPRQEVSLFFSNNGHVCPPGENMADFLLDSTTVDTRTPAKLKETKSSVGAIQAAYAKSEHARDAHDISERTLNKAAHSVATGMEKSHTTHLVDTRWNLNWFMEFYILLHRAWKNVVREPRATFAAFSQAIFMGLVTGIVFWDLQHDQDGIRDRLGLLFFVTLHNSFLTLQAVTVLFHQAKGVFNRERNAGCYRVSSFYMAKSLVEIPWAVLPAILYTCIFYFMCNLEATAEAFFKTIFTIIVIVFTAQSFGIAISAASPTFEVSQILGPICTVILMLFGGFYVSVNSIPAWLSWLEAFSFMQYLYSALVHTQFKEVSFSCTNETFCLETGHDVIVEYGFDGEHRGYWSEIGKCFGLAVLFRIIAYLALRFMFRVKLRLD